MNPPWFEDSESDDDDWMSQNIAKYEHLFMYKLEHSPLKIKIHPEGKHILLLSRTKKSKYSVRRCAKNASCWKHKELEMSQTLHFPCEY